jgi:hypothetical protein
MMGGAHRGEDREHADGADRTRNHEAMTGDRFEAQFKFSCGQMPRSEVTAAEPQPEASVKYFR